MKIYPTQQNFQKHSQIIRPNTKTSNRITIGAYAMFATLLLGSAYMSRDRDYFESKKALIENNIFTLAPQEIDALVERFNLSNLNITPLEESNKYSYQAKIGHFKTISGEFYKKENEIKKELIQGSYKERGLFNEINYNFSIEHPYNDNGQKRHLLTIKCSSEQTPEKFEKYNIYQDKDSKRFYINGLDFDKQKDKEGKSFALLILAIALANLYFVSQDESGRE